MGFEPTLSRVTAEVPCRWKTAAIDLVLLAGLEPARLAASDFKSGVSTDSTTEAKIGALSRSRTSTPFGNGF